MQKNSTNNCRIVYSSTQLESDNQLMFLTATQYIQFLVIYDSEKSVLLLHSLMIIKRQKNEKKKNAIFKFSNLARECWKRDAEFKVKSRFF